MFRPGKNDYKVKSKLNITQNYLNKNLNRYLLGLFQNNILFIFWIYLNQQICIFWFYKFNFKQNYEIRHSKHI